MPNQLRKERHGDVLVVTFCNLSRANAVDDRVLLALQGAIHEAADNGARARCV